MVTKVRSEPVTDRSAWRGEDLLADRPEDLPRLFQGFEWDRMGEHREGETPTTGYRVPFFSEAEGKLSCRYNRGWIAPAAERLGRPFGGRDAELFDYIDEVNRRDCLAIDFRPGDVQFVNNYTVFHGRAAHAEVPEEERKRLLLRIWLELPGIRPFADEAVMRYGVVRHGALGWSAADVVAGRHLGAVHARRADGAPLPGPAAGA